MEALEQIEEMHAFQTSGTGSVPVETGESIETVTPDPDREPASRPQLHRQFPLEKITAKDSIQVRVVIDPQAVADYTQIIASGQAMDPMDLFEENGVFLLADGFQRRLAYLKAGRTVAPVRIRPGGESAALELAIRMNCSHGKPMSNADKRHAVELAVADARIGQFSDQKIARYCRVSPSLVGQVRRGESPAAARAKRERRKKTVKVTAHERTVSPRDPVTHGVSARERAPEPAKNEVVDDRLKTIREWIESGKIGEEEIVASFATEAHRFRWFARDGRKITVRLKGKSGRYRNFEATLDALEQDQISLTVQKGYKFEVEG